MTVRTGRTDTVRVPIRAQATAAFTASLQVELIGMETCGRSHFPGRALREQGHEVRLMPAQYVKPHVKTNKSDYIDAEAVGRPKMRFVPVSPYSAGNASRRQPIVGSRTSFWGPNPVSKCEAGLSGTWQGFVSIIGCFPRPARNGGRWWGSTGGSRIGPILGKERAQRSPLPRLQFLPRRQHV